MRTRIRTYWWSGLTPLPLRSKREKTNKRSTSTYVINNHAHMDSLHQYRSRVSRTSYEQNKWFLEWYCLVFRRPSICLFINYVCWKHFLYFVFKYGFLNYKLISKTKGIAIKNDFVLSIAKPLAASNTTVIFFNSPPPKKKTKFKTPHPLLRVRVDLYILLANEPV